MPQMKALLAKRYGNADVLRFEMLPIPQPADTEILIRVAATTVNRTDTGILSGKPAFARLVFGIRKPRRPIRGTEFSGVVQSVGRSRTDFQVGDRVFGFHDEGTSSHAEFLTVSKREAIAKIPDGLSFEAAAASSEGPFYALNLIRHLTIQPGDRVLINGISGGIGSAMLQLMKLRQAYVVGVCSSMAAPALTQLGADKLYDYEKEDFREFENQPFDFVLDTVGNQSYRASRGLVAAQGTYSATELGPWCQNVFYAISKSITGYGQAIFPIPKDPHGCQKTMVDHLSRDDYQPLVDRTYSFDEIVDAYKFVSTGMKTGNVIVKFNV